MAGEIAHGDHTSGADTDALSRRVSPANPRTEVGRLGLSLNEMLMQIEQAFADRRESEDRLRQFLADASHELRTPLASIRGYAEAFRLGAATDPETLERAMARIEAEAIRMGVLVEDLLLLASLDELPEQRRARVDLCELAEQAAADARAVTPGRRITLSTDSPIPVLADPDQLRQVVANLIRNALIHTPADSPIELSVWCERDRAVLEVRDHGPGLPADAGDRVFERFWRAEGGRRRGRAAPDSGLRSSRQSCKPITGRCTRATRPTAAPYFASPCRPMTALRRRSGAGACTSAGTHSHAGLSPTKPLWRGFATPGE